MLFSNSNLYIAIDSTKFEAKYTTRYNPFKVGEFLEKRLLREPYKNKEV